MAYLLRNMPVEAGQLPTTWDWALGFQAFGETVPGPVPLDMEELLDEAEEHHDAGRITAAFGASLRTGLPQVNGTFLSTVFARIGEDAAGPAVDKLTEATQNPGIRDALLWACCALFEVTAPTYHPFHKHVGFVHGQPWFDRVSSTRANGPGRKVISGAEPFDVRELRTLQESGAVPNWFTDWCAGQRSLLIATENRPQPRPGLRHPVQPRPHPTSPH
jgi:hypothetical protein